MDNTYRPRWGTALFVSAPRGILAGTAGAGVAVLAGQIWDGSAMVERWPIMWPLFVAFGTVGAAGQLRTRRLTVSDEGLVLIRDGCRISMLWRDFEQVQVRRTWLVPMAELVFREGDVRAIDVGAPFATGRAARYRRAGLDRRIQPGLYAPDWRASPLGVANPA